MKNLILAGRLPYVATAIFALAAFMAGRATAPQPAPHFAVAEKSGVILEAIMTQSAPNEAAIVKQVQGVLDRYAGAGYAVIDVARDDRGGMAVAALPAGSIDVTAELRAALRLPPLPMADASTGTPRGAAPAARETVR